MNTGVALARLGYEISPIILTNGIATSGGIGQALSSIPILGSALNMVPIIVYTEAFNLIGELLTSGGLSLESFFAHFRPLPGGTLIDNAIGTYPFANQAVAANAIIAQPLKISMLMVCPVKGTLGVGIKQITMMNLQSVLAKHNSLGGTYTIITPSFLYTDCIMTAMTDVSGAESNQAQWQWRLDFEQPLVSLVAAAGALGTLMDKLTSGANVGPSPSLSGGATASTSLPGSSAIAPTSTSV